MKLDLILTLQTPFALSYNIKYWIKHDSFDMSFEKFVNPVEPLETYFKKLK